MEKKLNKILLGAAVLVLGNGEPVQANEPKAPLLKYGDMKTGTEIIEAAKAQNKLEALISQFRTEGGLSDNDIETAFHNAAPGEDCDDIFPNGTTFATYNPITGEQNGEVYRNCYNEGQKNTPDGVKNELIIPVIIGNQIFEISGACANLKLTPPQPGPPKPRRPQLIISDCEAILLPGPKATGDGSKLIADDCNAENNDPDRSRLIVK